jgi:hypothetical protein
MTLVSSGPRVAITNLVRRAAYFSMRIEAGPLAARNWRKRSGPVLGKGKWAQGRVVYHSLADKSANERPSLKRFFHRS